MTPSTREVHCYTFPLTPTEVMLAHAHTLLSPDERKRAEQFHFKHHRTHFIAARGYLRLILGHALNQDPAKLIFTYGKHQKPGLLNDPLHFNLAHSGELGALAIALTHPVGIDLEQLQHEAKLGIAERYFSPQEIRHLQACSGIEQRDAFFNIWARKEAVVKAIGTGLQQSLASFTVPFGETNATLTIDQHPWCIWPLHLHKDYASALATHPSIEKISFWQWVDNRPIQDEQKKHF